MISVLAQERLLGFALGGGVTAALVAYQHRGIDKSLSDFHAQFSPQTKVREAPLEKKRSGPEIAHLWNITVDQTFGSLIEYLSSRGW